MSLNPRMLRRIRLGLAARLLILLALLAGWSLSPLPKAHAATGDFLGEVTFNQNCASGIGVGVAYDGAGHLWVSCYASRPDLLRASATTGVVDQTYTIAGDLGALAYDGTRNALWAPEAGSVHFIQLDASRSVVSSNIAFSPGGDAGSLVDGVAFDGTNDTLYFKPDNSNPIHHYTTTGVKLADITGASSCNGPDTSGLAIGGNDLFEGKNGCSHVFVVDKVTNAPVFDFSTVIASDPNHRDEGLSCDTDTFAALGKQVMWSKEAYSPNRAAAFEIPTGTCGSGGRASDTTPPTCVLKGTIPGGIAINVQDSDGGLAATTGGTFTTAPSPAGGVQLTAVDNASVTIPPNKAGATALETVTATKITAGVSSHVSLKVTDAAGNVTLCDPVLTGVLRDTGRPDVTLVNGIAQSEGKVYIFNGSPGVAQLTLSVNGTAFHLHDLAANQQLTLDISAELAATNNRVILVAAGRPLGEATVLFADR